MSIERSSVAMSEVTSGKFAESLEQTFGNYGFPLTQNQVEQLTRYRTELCRWNRRINLTAITKDEEIIRKHFLDSLGVLKYITLHPKAAVIDIGTGAGFPGMVLKIYVPDIWLTLVEAKQKKVSFLKFLTAQLIDVAGNANCTSKVQVLAERAETCAREPCHIGVYDWVFTRYVASLRDAAAYCLPLLKSTGKWVAYKSGEETVHAEIRDSATRFDALGGAVETVFTSSMLNRHYIVISRLNKA